jgi:negative regulator of sigma E activity
MSPEQLEFILTQYLDGTLPPEQLDALERTLETDPRAQALRHEHERLTALLRSQQLPELDWDDLARDFCAVVTGSVDEQTHAEDQQLNAILATATPLPELQWDELSRRISAAVDVEIETGDAEDQQLVELLRSAPMPAVNWDRLAGHLSQTVAAETAAATATPMRIAGAYERPAVVGRIGWVRTASRMAMAACVLLAAGVGIRMYMHNPGTPSIVGPTPPPPRGQAIVMIDTPQIEKANQPAVAEISIGPSKEYVASSDSDSYRRGVASRSPVVIAAPVSSDDESAAGLGFE